MRNVFFCVYHKSVWDKEWKYIVYRNKWIDFSKIKVVNEYCRWVHASVRSVKNSGSLEIFNASITDLQAIMKICHAQYYFKYNLKSYS